MEKPAGLNRRAFIQTLSRYALPDPRCLTDIANLLRTGYRLSRLVASLASGYKLIPGNTVVSESTMRSGPSWSA